MQLDLHHSDISAWALELGKECRYNHQVLVRLASPVITFILLVSANLAATMLIGLGSQLSSDSGLDLDNLLYGQAISLIMVFPVAGPVTLVSELARSFTQKLGQLVIIAALASVIACVYCIKAYAVEGAPVLPATAQVTLLHSIVIYCWFRWQMKTGGKAAA